MKIDLLDRVERPWVNPSLNDDEPTYQHSCTQIKLLKELCNKQMYGDKIIDILLFYFTDDVCQPFELFLRPCYPNVMNLSRHRKKWCYVDFR